MTLVWMGVNFIYTVKQTECPQPFIHNKRFFNNSFEKFHPVLWPSLKMLVASIITGNYFKKLENFNKKPDLAAHNQVRSNLSQKSVVTWIGHSTFLISVPGFTIITDPVLWDITFFLTRAAPAGIIPQELPPIDIILLSHNHRDHMDEASLRFIYKRFPAVTLIVPRGDKAWFTARNIPNVVECDWGDSLSFMSSAPVSIQFLPAHHWSQRGLFDRNRSLWGSWMITSPDSTIFFAGDSAYASHFSYIGNIYASIDCAIMPIGPCEPHRIMKTAHLAGEQCLQAFLDTQARMFIPMHWGTFPFGTDYPLLPAERLMQAWDIMQKENPEKLEGKIVRVPFLGETFGINKNS